MTTSIPIPLLEQSECTHLAQQAHALITLTKNPTPPNPTPPILIHEPPPGLAIRTTPSNEGKLNCAVGLAISTPLTSHALTTLEHLYAEIGLYPEIHLSETAHPSAKSLLQERGYRVVGEVGVYLLSSALSSLSGLGDGEGLEVTELVNPTAEEKEEFVAASVAGFRDTGRKEDLLALLARLATVRADTGLFVAREAGGEVVGCAALGVLETGGGEGEKIGHLYLDSTVPGYRGKGVHGALIRARLNRCRELGLKVVTLATGVGGGSARNAEREGFELGYRKDVWVYN
ncbi:hypothetical protein BO78DRAFT_42969 [Aspergillus sclerotiicarbonarius CBS 121057]|uniref:N-acetyltransferase domain-containing protein n=1 Tax=Aspergillus sclerotiicarbonarius (strain CBS 121057 / IBT 28362) TaxID=1448318 RepID=A0A319DRR4_ASPSB|nr:hypothetical protein BO78DRAFT_42969 [Aspergillus sclerotiicarbonarius CBS 121057]